MAIKKFYLCLIAVSILQIRPLCAAEAAKENSALREAERKALSMANWWKYKYNIDPAFQAPPPAAPLRPLPQYSIEEKPRSDS